MAFPNGAMIYDDSDQQALTEQNRVKSGADGSSTYPTRAHITCDSHLPRAAIIIQLLFYGACWRRNISRSGVRSCDYYPRQILA